MANQKPPLGGSGNGLGMRANRLRELDNPFTPLAQTPPPPVPAGTGGNLPPTAKPPQGTGGNLAPSVTPPQGTGGNLPPNLTRPPLGTGGNLPPDPTVTNPNDPMARPPMGTGGNQPPLVNPDNGAMVRPVDPNAQQGGGLQGGFSPVNVVNDTVTQLLNPNNSYIANARRRGLEAAARGGVRAGSSISAGASERAAMEAVQPLVNNAMALQSQREGFAFQGEQSALDRNHDFTRAQLSDWTNSRQFDREFYGALSMMPIQSAYQLNSLIQNYALENPDVYTADVISGMSNFFNQNFLQILSTYFPNMGGGTP